jgi:trimethylamine:corrinoid methyltransferase-like protein
MQTRRIFLLKSIGAAVALPAAGQAFAQTAAKVDPKDAQAIALGYVEDASKADAKKFPKWAKDQQCTSCQLYIKKGDDGWGGCSIFPNKLIASKGWCSAWIKKA